LLRYYTQNIDCIERQLPDLWGKTVQLHGRIDEAFCQHCGWKEPLISARFSKADLPDCSRCQVIAWERERTGKRQRGIGRLRPSVVLYGEDHPQGDLIGAIAEKDLRTGVDVVLVVGTALKVAGAKRLVRELCHVAKARGGVAIWISKDPPPSYTLFDIAIQGDCDVVASLLSH